MTIERSLSMAGWWFVILGAYVAGWQASELLVGLGAAAADSRSPNIGTCARAPLRYFAAAALCLAVSAAGCAGVSERVNIEETFVRMDIVDSEPETDVRHATEWHFEGDVLVVDIDSWQECYREASRVVHQTRVTTRTLDHDARATFALVGAVVIGSGLALLLTEEPPPEEPVFPSDEEPVGEISDEAAIAIAGAGVAIFGMTIVDTVRQLDRREDLGLASQPTGDRSPFACNEGTGVDEPAVLSLPDGRVLESEIVDGRARFDVAGVRPGGIDGVATLTVGGRTEPVSLMAMQSYRDAVAHQSRYVAPPPPRPAFPGPCRWDAEVALQGVDEVVLAYDTEGRVVSSTAADAGGNPMWIRETEWDDGLIEAVRSAREPILAPAGSGLMDRDLLGPLAPAAAPDIDVEAVPEYDERGDIAAWAVNECGRRRCDDDDRLAFLFEHTGGRSRCTVAPGMDSCPVYREWVGADGVRAGTVRYRYDGRDRLVAATYADGRGHWSVGFESDDAGRVASASSSAGVAFTWERDASGNVTRMQATSSNGATMLAYTADYTCWERAGVSP